MCLAAVVVQKGSCVPPNFDYSFAGYTKLTQLLIEDCTDILGQVRHTVAMQRVLFYFIISRNTRNQWSTVKRYNKC